MLIVDDYRDAADALRLLLEARGFECRIAVDPFAVCAIARDWQPFAVVLDIAMPGLDGLQLARGCAVIHTGDMLLVACSGSRRDAIARRSKPGSTRTARSR